MGKRASWTEAKRELFGIRGASRGANHGANLLRLLKECEPHSVPARRLAALRKLLATSEFLVPEDLERKSRAAAAKMRTGRPPPRTLP